MENYLENHAAETGRGTKDKSDFKIVDFIGHKSKLRELNRLISSNEQMEIDWEAFFDKSTDEYAAYVDSILNKAEDGKKSNASDAAVYDASDVFSIDPYAHLMWDGKTEEHAISFEDQKHEIVVSKLSSGVIRDKEVYKLFSNLDQKRNYRKLIFDFLAKF
jgi:hypothetical protein